MDSRSEAFLLQCARRLFSPFPSLSLCLSLTHSLSQPFTHPPALALALALS